jgi:prepilin peptidase CpaA
MLNDNQFVYCVAGLICAVIAAGCDIRNRRIPNMVTGIGLAAGLLLHLSVDGWHGWLTAGFAALIAGFVFFIFFMAGGMGGGDVKLIAAVACLCGLQNMGYLLLFTSLAGGAMGIWLAATRGSLRHTFGNMFALASHHIHKGLTPHPELNVENGTALRLPYGVAIAAGCLLTLCMRGAQS